MRPSLERCKYSGYLIYFVAVLFSRHLDRNTVCDAQPMESPPNGLLIGWLGVGRVVGLKYFPA
jgi:hypothetical protein